MDGWGDRLCEGAAAGGSSSSFIWSIIFFVYEYEVRVQQSFSTKDILEDTGGWKIVDRKFEVRGAISS